MLESIDKRRKIIVITIFLLMTVIGLMVTPDYGMPWDEPTEMAALGTNIREYIGFFRGEDKEPEKSATGIRFPDQETTLEIDHGQSVYYPISPVFFFDLGTDGPRELSLIIHGYIFFLFMMGVIGLYFIATFLTKSWKYGIVSSLFLYLSPRFFAEGHYNSKDIVSMAMLILCFWFYIRFMESKKLKYITLFALFSAISANMRIVGFAFFGLAVAFYIIMLITCKKMDRKNLLLGILSTALFFAFYFLLTPVAWKDPVSFISYTFSRSSNFSAWSGVVYYMGQSYRPVPWHYIPVMFAITSPILIVILTVIGNLTTLISIVRTKITKIFEGDLKYYLMSQIFVWTFLGYAMIRQPILYNGWRHFYFLYGFLIILAMHGLKQIFDYLKDKEKRKRLVAVIISLQLIVSGVTIVLVHPNEIVFYNMFAGSDPGSRFEMDYWNVNMINALTELVDSQVSDKVITVIALDYYSYNGLFTSHYMLPDSYKQRIEIDISTNKATLQDADYLIINPIAYNITKDRNNAAAIDWIPDVGLDMYMTTYKEAVVLRAFGSDYMMIYEIPKANQ